jgi:hypothetical protein
MLFAAFNYIFKHDLILEVFNKLGYPAYIIYPLAVAKVLGVVAILTKKSRTLKEWAYAGFFFNFILAASAHLNADDGVNVAPALVSLVLLAISYFTDRKIYG